MSAYQTGVSHLTLDVEGEVWTVEVGQPYKDQWVIKSGLEKGERVIVDGLQKVRPGSVVDPVPAQAPQSEAPSA